jgi:hypothetical protein
VGTVADDKFLIGLLKFIALEIVVAFVMYVILLIMILTWSEKF